MPLRVAERFSLLLVLLLSWPASAAGWGLDELMAGLARQRSGEASFAETKHLSTLKVPLKSEGRLRFRYPDYLEKEVLKPTAERYVVAGDALEIYRDGQLKHLMPLADYPVMAGFMTATIATMGGDLAALRRHFDVSLEGGRSQWTLHLKPLEQNLRERIQEITVQGSGEVMRTFEIRQRNGDRSIMSIAPLA